MISLHRSSIKTNRINPLHNDIAFYIAGNSHPFAFRAADSCELTGPAESGTVLSQICAFSLYECNGNLYCMYNNANKVIFCISSPKKSQIDLQTVRWIESYLISTYKLDPYAVSARTAFEKFEQLVTDVAEFCGCLTENVRESNSDLALPFFTSYCENINCEHIALAIPIITLMYRRISALRGFNFKVTLNDSMLCLIFSARVLLQGKGSTPDLANIREYSALKDILGNGGMIIGAKLRATDDIEEDGTAIHKLSVIICPQEVDPQGILRAPVWKQHVQTIIDDMDISIEGKF